MTTTMLFTVPCLALVVWMLARSVWDVIMDDDDDDSDPYR